MHGQDTLKLPLRTLSVIEFLNDVRKTYGISLWFEAKSHNQDQGLATYGLRQPLAAGVSIHCACGSGSHLPGAQAEGELSLLHAIGAQPRENTAFSIPPLDGMAFGRGGFWHTTLQVICGEKWRWQLGPSDSCLHSELGYSRLNSRDFARLK